jgi:hypothetical protein
VTGYPGRSPISSQPSSPTLAPHPELRHEAFTTSGINRGEIGRGSTQFLPFRPYIHPYSVHQSEFRRRKRMSRNPPWYERRWRPVISTVLAHGPTTPEAFMRFRLHMTSDCQAPGADQEPAMLRRFLIDTVTNPPDPRCWHFTCCFSALPNLGVCLRLQF